MNKKNNFFILTLLLFFVNFTWAQNGYIYVHKKAASEIGSPDFMFQNTTLGTNFTLNDGPSNTDLNAPLVLNTFDLGASQGAGAGQLWAVVSPNNFSAGTHLSTSTSNNMLFTRKVGSSVWEKVNIVLSTFPRSVDGIGQNTAVFSDSRGDVYRVDATNVNAPVLTKIYARPGSGTNSNMYAVDVASSGSDNDIVAVIGAPLNTTTTTLPVPIQNRKLYRYSGTGETLTNWSAYDNAGDKVFRVDWRPGSNQIYYINFINSVENDQNVYIVDSATNSASYITTIPPHVGTIYPSGSEGPSNNNRRDIAVSQTGKIYGTFSLDQPYAPSTGITLMEYYNNQWHYNEQGRGLVAPTSSLGDQVWSVNKANAGLVEHAIYTKTFDGTWLDDERVRSRVYINDNTLLEGNSIILPVAAGTYTIQEAANADYKVSEIVIYDPTNNSTSSITNRSAQINVAAGEVVHVIFQNTKINSIAIPAGCNENMLIDFGRGTATYGPPLDGITAYHYKYPNINPTASSITSSTGDGYYTLAKNSVNFFVGPNSNPTVVNHTPSDPDGYFAIFNAAYAKDDFFRRTLTNLIVGTKYRLSFWAANLTPGNELKPNAIMEIVDENGVSMGKVVTGDITGTEWKVYTFTFTATSTTGEIFLRNNGVGGSGNDIAIDDITISANPAEINPIVGTTQICLTPYRTYQFTNATPNGTWSSDNGSILSINATTGVATVNTNALVGNVNITYTYVDPTTQCISYAFYQVSVTKDCNWIDAVNDINQTPKNTQVSGNVVTNDESSNSIVTVTSAQYYNSSGVLTNLDLGVTTAVYTTVGTMNGLPVLAGQMTLNANGTYTFVPATDFVGEVPFVYTAGNTTTVSDTASLTIKVLPSMVPGVNSNPVAQNDTASTEMGVSVTSNALANDSDPNGNTLVITGASQGSQGLALGATVTVSGVDMLGNSVPNAGTIIINSDGTYTFTPNAGFAGTINPINYTISDGNGGVANANIYISVDSNLGNVTYANDDANTGPKGEIMTGNVLLNDTDPEGDVQAVTDARWTGTTLSVGTPTTIAGVGTLTLNADGSYSFEPEPNYIGTTSVVYTVCDNHTVPVCAQATLYLTTLENVEEYCYKLPTLNSGVTVPTNHGITALSRASNGSWPTVRQSAWTVLEAKTKGFVVNRVEFATDGNPVGIQASNFIEGMMVYDTTNNCLKIYNGTVWNCYSTPACP